jgi:hypothetical protein
MSRKVYLNDYKLKETTWGASPIPIIIGVKRTVIRLFSPCACACNVGVGSCVYCNIVMF